MDSAPASRMRPLRGVLLAAGLGFIFAGPVWVQFLGGRLGPFTRSWRMYRMVPYRSCEVSYLRHQNGEVSPLDRAEVLGVEDFTRHRDFWLTKKAQIRHHGRDLCRALGGSKDDIRPVARCAHFRGVWEQLYDGSENICR